MITQRATLSLRGNNLRIPNRYKIRSIKQSKINTFSDQQQNKQQLKFQISPFKVKPKLIEISQLAPSFKEKIVKPTDEDIQDAQQKITKKSKAVSSIGIRTNTKPSYHFKQIVLSNKQSKRCTCGDCDQCIKDFPYFLHLFTDDQSVPQISAKSWCVWRRKINNKYTHYFGKRIHKSRQIASLSKMITAMTMIDYMIKYDLDPQKVMCEIKKNSTVIGGTSANLQLGEVYSLLDLLYAMMLPSGNDAAIAISETIGLMIQLKSKNKQFDPYSNLWYQPYKNKSYSYHFIGLMNQKCQKIGTIDTHMYNSHGNDAYDQLKNVSTCNEIAKISCQFMNYPLLRAISSTKSYKQWQNTNKLLMDGFEGIKTGITQTAGPCLAAAYRDYIIVVLNSKSMNERWIEVKKLVKWIMMKTNNK